MLNRLLILLAVLVLGNSAAEARIKSVLVLHSYHQNFAWSDSINAGIRQAFGGKASDYDFHYEYLDYKRNPDPFYLKAVAEMLTSKSRQRKFDVVISADNAALNFVLDHRQDFLRNVPMVFCGVNSFDRSLLKGDRNVTGVVENIDFTTSIELILKLHPGLQTLAIINDSTDTSVLNTREFKSVIKNYKINVQYLSDMRLSALKKHIGSLPANSAILVLGFIYDDNGLLIPTESSFRELSASVSVPIYGVWDFLTGNGIVGGIITSGVEQGRSVGRYALSILEGKDVAEIPIEINSPNKYVFDYRQLTRFNIDQSQLPKSSRILNKPSRVYSIGITTFWITISILFSLLVLVISLFIYIKGRKKVEYELLRAKQLAEKSDDLKSEFLAQMSHEIRTPINNILSFTSLIKEEVGDSLDDDLKSSFSIVARAGNRIIRTINLLLNVSEMQTNNYIPNFKRLDLYPIITGLYRNYSQASREKGVELKLVKQTEESFILGDEYSVTQIFDNLLDNAVKYTNKGAIDIIMSDHGGKLAIQVRDTGIGISEEYLPDLFKAFRQEQQGYTRRYEGNGLGMLLIKKYCELNNAEISVKSKKGEGTIFSVTFERVDQPAEELEMKEDGNK